MQYQGFPTGSQVLDFSQVQGKRWQPSTKSIPQQFPDYRAWHARSAMALQNRAAILL